MNARYDIRGRIDILLLLVVLPLVGARYSGRELASYLEFPPTTRHVAHAAFCWPVFVILGVLILAAVVPFAIRWFRAQKEASAAAPGESFAFPWWGWAGLAFLACAWVLAWMRFAWFADWQPFTFTPLWVGYIVVVNALTCRRKGRCMMLERPGRFAALFAVSAAFWWYFEYLNRFVENWYYAGIGTLTKWEYFVFATLPFSTVLPAVLSTCEFLETYPRLTTGLDRFPPVRARYPRASAVAVFLLCGAALAGIGAWPDLLFPMLWLSPLLMVVSYQAIRGERTMFSGVADGDWRRICLLALSALICGFFWEMWNYRSLAQWKYSVPFVGRFRIFEMPILGYAGYLPFGLECALVGEFLLGDRKNGMPPAASVWANVMAYGNAVVLAAIALYFFVAPGFIVMRDLADPALRSSGIPRIAWRVHRSLTSRYEGYARARVASGVAGHLNRLDVPATEWPMFGSVYYLWATESLQAAWEKDPSVSREEPRVYARDTIEAAVDLIVDPIHHTWVQEHWGTNYMHTQNVFFRSLIIAGLTSHEKLIGDGKHRELLRDQVDTLAAELDASPHGVLEDYPRECYPIDVLASIACIQRADKVLGTDHSAFIARSVRGFTGQMADKWGLPPFFVDDYRTGRFSDPSRGTGNSYILIFAYELWPDLAKRWYETFEKEFWQELSWAAGYREYPRAITADDWGFDVDAGAIIAGFSPAANAFGLAAAKINGRLDHAWTLANQVLPACWPLPDGSLLGPRLISDVTGRHHAPYLGEACMLFFLSQATAPGMELRTGGFRPAPLVIGYVFYFGLGLAIVAAAVMRVRAWRKDRDVAGIRLEGAQFGLWVLMLGAGAGLLVSGSGVFGMLAILGALLLPRYERATMRRETTRG